MAKAFKESKHRRHRPGETKLNQEFSTVWIEPSDEKYKHEGEWVTVRDIGDYWEGTLVESPPGSLMLLWMKEMYQVDLMKVYHPPPTLEYIVVWIQSKNNPRAPYKAKVRDYGTYWRGHRLDEKFKDTNPEEAWPKFAYKIVLQEKVKIDDANRPDDRTD